MEITWIALALVVVVIGIEIFFRIKNSKNAPEEESKYREALVEIQSMASSTKIRSDLTKAVSMLDDIAGTCKSVLE